MLTRIRDVDARSEACGAMFIRRGGEEGQVGVRYLARLLFEGGELLDGSMDVCLFGIR